MTRVITASVKPFTPSIAAAADWRQGHKINHGQPCAKIEGWNDAKSPENLGYEE